MATLQSVLPKNPVRVTQTQFGNAYQTPKSGASSLQSRQLSLTGGQVKGDQNTRGNRESLKSILDRTPFEDSGDDKKERKRQEQLINESFAPALQALTQFQTELQGLLPGQIAAEEQRGAGLKQEALGEQQARLGEYAGQRTQAVQDTESAVAEARRQAAELQQGNQARFGGSSGTGAFVGELLGREALKNISQNRIGLQNTLAQIGQAETNLKNKVQSIVSNIDQTTRDAVTQLQSNLMERIADINMSKAGLEAQKTQSKIDLVNQFRNDRKAIEARNAQLKQQLFLQYEQAQGTFDKFKNEEQDSFSTTIQKLEAAGLIPSADPNTQYTVEDLRAPTPAGTRFQMKPREEDEGPF